MDSTARHSTYTPTLNRSLSFTSQSSTNEPPLASDALVFNDDITTTGNRPKRNKSLVRPERERIDPNHRQYHYRQAATKRGPDHVVPSTTGNQPARPLERRPTARQVLLRRGRSILGREEKQAEEDDIVAQPRRKKSCWKSLPSPWMTYCRIITCCIPKPLLRMVGIPDGPAQMAWREKIGLVSFILLIMAFVGFLTFGFTQAVCPIPPLSVHGGQVSPGYLIINGWAYMLADWSQHPAIPGMTNDSTNLLYPPVNGGGMDASFLFQTPSPSCASVFLPKQGNQPVYFPCQLFNPNNTVPPDPNTFTNQTRCHLGQASRNQFQNFQVNGVPSSKGELNKAARVYYNWTDITMTNYLMVYNNDVLNLRLLQSLPPAYYDVPPGGLIQQILADMGSFGGKDMSRAINAYREPNSSWQKEADCLSTVIKVGAVDTLSVGCMASQIVLYVSLAVILGVIIVKFVLAVIFGWFLSWKLGNFKEGDSYAARMKREAEIENWTRDIHTAAPLSKPKQPPSYNKGQANKRKSLFPQTSRFTQPLHGSTRFDTDKLSTPLWKTPSGALSTPAFGASRPGSSYFGASPSARFLGDAGSMRMSGMLTPLRPPSVYSSDLQSDTSSNTSGCPFPLSPHVVPRPPPDYMPFNFPLAYTICLVTCYSEGEDGIRTTLDSIATSDYPNSHKLLLVICDGLITGHGNAMSTPDVCVSMMQDFIVDPKDVQPEPYVAIADGSKRNNMGKVYAGYYKYDDNTIDPAHQQRVPMITIVKCGTPEEANEAKPGNRGKRDSQIILMQFMQKVMFDERMTTMEYDFFNAIWRITGVTPDSYEICLMVDADTKLYPDALSRLVSCAVKDPDISGLCGETKIANKTGSWVSMIQVFEYYISHHQSKAFESIFGGVTCLPGCFCMYRIKAPKGPNGYWVPVLANPDIVEHYSENVVDTLHKKNLLLLGEDRYLSTLMLRTFPNRKMMFVPQAVCKTVVPDTFSVLLSQRRRWINSTIHNLMELLFVHDLCGTFCFSMQFVVFMELVGTLALPAAISFTIYLVIMAILGQPALIPLILLAVILGLPAVLIVMTSRKVVYVGWMLVYLFSLPIWNFVLPTYAYWHFDDFSWGDTRKIAGAGKESGHGDKEGEFDSSRIVMKKWSEYEKERRINQALERNLPLPRFLERPRSVDIFRDSQMFKRLSKAGSSGSNESEMPLTQMDYTGNTHPNPGANGPAGGSGGASNSSGLVPSVFHKKQPHDYFHRTADMPLTTLHPVHQRLQETEDELAIDEAVPATTTTNSKQKNDYFAKSEDSGTTTAVLTNTDRDSNWIQHSTHDNNWANPAPHHTRYHDHPHSDHTNNSTTSPTIDRLPFDNTTRPSPPPHKEG
ncbi:chitin synthase-domain-containing protein [Radiomyces spectabilis]|uniref:chitin synthase-domain-containing protein n=1 Tax=Radiomyces spectabilis TaxID=64574 RepID=UPI0022204761|nr:chitin synthase-domain-containing protein [Radiomyces spectabilis]KAI8393356.1 chitin synthase-domain-containing protein [Radiomyces spectabilis]